MCGRRSSSRSVLMAAYAVCGSVWLASSTETFCHAEQLRRRDVVPVRAAVGGQPDQSVVGARPDAVDVDRRRRERVDHAALLRLRRRLGVEDANRRRHVERLARQVGADLLPAVAAIARGPKRVGREVHQVRIEGREDDRLGANHAKVRRSRSGIGIMFCACAVRRS